jgi:hypothetical protein
MNSMREVTVELGSPATKWRLLTGLAGHERDRGGGRELLSRLEEFDRVSGRIVYQDLLTSGAGHNIVTESHTGGSKTFYLDGEILDYEVDAIPTA